MWYVNAGKLSWTINKRIIIICQIDSWNIITNKKREPLLNSIASVFISQYKKHKNIKEAKVTTAHPLTLELKQEIIKYIKKNEEVDVEITEVVDKNIIGGTIFQQDKSRGL